MGDYAHKTKAEYNFEEQFSSRLWWLAPIRVAVFVLCVVSGFYIAISDVNNWLVILPICCFFSLGTIEDYLFEIERKKRFK